jgi:hypothetical protein
LVIYFIFLQKLICDGVLGLHDDEEEEKYRQLQIMRHRNGSINSPSLK